MAALTADRAISRKGAEPGTAVPGLITCLVKTGVTIYKGALVCIDNVTGFAVPGTVATTLIAIGIATKQVVAGAAASGTYTVDVQRGLYPFAFAGGAVVQADMGKKVYIVDDNSVTDVATGASVAGVFLGFDEGGLALVQVGNLSQTGV